VRENVNEDVLSAMDEGPTGLYDPFEDL